MNCENTDKNEWDKMVQTLAEENNTTEDKVMEAIKELIKKYDK